MSELTGQTTKLPKAVHLIYVTGGVGHSLSEVCPCAAYNTKIDVFLKSVYSGLL